MGIDYKQLAKDQTEDPDTQAYRYSPGGLKVAEIPGEMDISWSFVISLLEDQGQLFQSLGGKCF